MKNKMRIKERLQKITWPPVCHYIRAHLGSLFGAFILAVLMTAAFTFMKYLGGLEKYKEGFSAPFSLISAAEFVKDDGDDLYQTMECYLWGSIHLAFIAFLAFYWIRRLSFLFGRRAADENEGIRIPEILAKAGRVLLAALLFVGFLVYDKETLDLTVGLVPGIVNCLDLSHLLAVPLGYLSRVPFAFTRFVLAFFLPAALLTDGAKLKRFGRRVYTKESWFIKTLVAVWIAIAGYVVVELSCESKLMVFLNLRFFALLYGFVLFWFIYILCRRICLSAHICLLLIEIVGLGNYIVMQFRGSYVMYGDLLVIGTALEVAGNYKLVLDRYFFIPLFVTLISCLGIRLLTLPMSKEEKKVRLALKQKKEGKSKKRRARRNKKRFLRPETRKRIVTTLVGDGLILLLFFVGMKTGLVYNFIKGNGWNYTQEVREHGYMPYFLSNIMATANVKLEGYSASSAEQAIKEGAEDYDESHESKEVQEPNIIVVQNEAFSDLSVVYDYELSEDCMPFIHSLTENTKKGYVNTSVTGGPTANTEFEFLTRYSFAYLSTGSIAYAQYVKNKMPSILTVLQNQEEPYYSIGYHPYHASGYNREGVYQTLGFDEGVFYEDTTGMDRIRKLLSDRADYQDVISMYEDKEKRGDSPLFVFNVTIQNHSPFTYLRDRLDTTIKTTSFAGSTGINNYFTLIRESDAAFEELVEYFAGVDEPTIILMYGDHQPSWDDTSSKIWEKHFLSTDKSEQTRDKYYVPYIMWANYDIEEYDGLKWGDNPGEKNTISMNYLSSLLLETAGVELSAYDKYLLNLHETVPAVTSKGWWNADGEWHDKADTEGVTDELFGYHEICYNILFDKKHKLWECYQ